MSRHARTISLLVLGLLGVMTSAASADLIAYWNFNNNTIGSPSTNLGNLNATGTSEVYDSTTKLLSIANDGKKAALASVNLGGLVGTNGGAATNNWGTFAGDVTNAVGATIAGGALSIVGSGNNASYIVFQMPTTGYEDLVMTYATRGTATGYSTQDISYSTDGSTFTAFASITGRNVTSWSTQTADFSSVPALDQQSNVYIRIAVSGASSTSGNNRFDNVQFNATAVPEPATLVLLTIGGIGALARRRRA